MNMSDYGLINITTALTSWSQITRRSSMCNHQTTQCYLRLTTDDRCRYRNCDENENLHHSVINAFCLEVRKEEGLKRK